MSRKETREQLFKEKLHRLQLEGEIRSLEFRIKYKELSRKIEDAEIKFNLTQTKLDN